MTANTATPVDMNGDELPHLNTDKLDAYIVANTEHDLETVQAVMRIEYEYMRCCGLIQMYDAQKNEPWYYLHPEEFPTCSGVDNEVVAQLAVRHLGLSRDHAHDILNAELDYLVEIGLVITDMPDEAAKWIQ